MGFFLKIPAVFAFLSSRNGELHMHERMFHPERR